MRPLLAAVFMVATTQSTLADNHDDAWLSKCTETSCTFSRVLSHAQTGQRMATFIAVVVKDEPEARFGAAIALGAALRPGIRFVPAEGASFDVPFEVCFPDGCRAIRAFGAEEEARFTGAQNIDIRFIAYQGGETVSMTMPLTGLGGALADARAQLSAD